MYCRVTTVRIKQGKLQEALDLYHNSVVPAAKAQKGFRGAQVMTDPATGRGVAISMWESEGDMVEGERNGYYRSQLGKFATMLADPPAMERYELNSWVEAEG